jgi:3-oxoacyl-[acyl-carrier-protein] synthase-3
MAFIKAISYYLPEFRLTNEILNRDFPEWSVDKISSKTGIIQRAISNENEFSSDMAIKASEKLFKEHNIDRSTIDFVLLCTQSPDYFLPTTACIIQHRLGLSITTGALDFNLGCSGFVYGLSLAKGLIESGLAKNILLITSETYSKFIHPKDKSNRTIFGDAAAASLITYEKGFCTMDNFVFGTDGSGAENLIVKQGGMRYPSKLESEDIVDDFGNIRNDKFLFMNGSEIFNFTNEFIPQLTSQVLNKANLVSDDIQLFVFHQANQYILNHLRKKMQIPEDKLYLYLKNCGNTVSSTIPIALHEAMNENKIKKDDNILIAGFGVGYSWAGCILKFS